MAKFARTKWKKYSIDEEEGRNEESLKQKKKEG